MFSPEDHMIQKALQLGVSDARLIDAARIRVEDDLARLCQEPACPGYGQGANCPPHVMQPEAFRRLRDRFPRALVFKFDVPTEVLLGDGRLAAARRVHATAAALEAYALANGCRAARGLAAGSCKQIFCADKKTCRVVAEKGGCRHPDQARPSISGLGVNVFELARTLGWPMEKITRDSRPEEVPMALMAGIVLLALRP